MECQYPLVHTNYWLSAWIGLELKKYSNIQLAHTYHSLGIVKYQATDTENFQFMPKGEARLKLGLNLNDKIVLYVGRFDPRKGIETAPNIKSHIAFSS